MSHAIKRTFSFAIAAIIANLATPDVVAAAPAPATLMYHGGPVISPDIKPVFWGTFDSYDIDTMQAYLQGLAGYLSGVELPVDTEPTLRQYGVWGAIVAPPIIDTSIHNGPIYNDDVLAEITRLGIAYGPQTIVLVMAKGQTQSSTYGPDWCAYHQTAGLGKYFAYVPFPSGTYCKGSGRSLSGAFQLITSHELFEASTDPHLDGWYATGIEGADAAGCVDSYVQTPYGIATKFIDNQSAITHNGTPICDYGSREEYSPLSVVSRGLGLLDVFYQGTDHALWQKRYNGSGWEAAHWLGGVLASAPSAVALGNDTIHVVNLGADRNMYDRSWTTAGGWSPDFVRVGPGGNTFIGNPSAIRTGWTRLDVVAQATHTAFDHAYFDGAWHYWDLGPSAGNNSNAITPPVAVPQFGARVVAPVVLFSNQRAEIMAAASDYTQPPVNPYPDSLDQSVAFGRSFSPLAGSYRDYGQIDVIALGSDKTLWHSLSPSYQTWTGWTKFPLGEFVGAPFALSTDMNTTHAFGVGADSFLYHAWTSDRAVTWSTQIVGGGNQYGSPVAVSWGGSRVDLFAKGSDQHLWHFWSNDGVSWGSESFPDTYVN